MGVPVIFFRSPSYVTDITILSTAFFFLLCIIVSLYVLFIALSENKIMILNLS